MKKESTKKHAAKSRPAKTPKSSKPTDDVVFEKLSKEGKIKYLEETRKKDQETYCRGKDSSLIVTGQLGKELYGVTTIVSQSDIALEKANKKYGWNYKDWEELSINEDLTEEFLDAHQNDVSWYFFLKSHPDRRFTKGFMNRYPKQFMMRTLGLV